MASASSVNASAMMQAAAVGRLSSSTKALRPCAPLAARQRRHVCGRAGAAVVVRAEQSGGGGGGVGAWLSKTMSKVPLVGLVRRPLTHPWRCCA